MSCDHVQGVCSWSHVLLFSLFSASLLHLLYTHRMWWPWWLSLRLWWKVFDMRATWKTKEQITRWRAKCSFTWDATIHTIPEHQETRAQGSPQRRKAKSNMRPMCNKVCRRQTLRQVQKCGLLWQRVPSWRLGRAQKNLPKVRQKQFMLESSSSWR